MTLTLRMAPPYHNTGSQKKITRSDERNKHHSLQQLAHQWSNATNTTDTTDPVGDRHKKKLQNRDATTG